MSEKRRDSKGVLLRTGESQRKDQRYQYRYQDTDGVRRTIYADTLKELRDQEEKIGQMTEDGLDYAAGNITVNELLQRYISLKTGVRYNTKVGYKFVLELIKKEPFGKRKIRDIKVSDAKLWFKKLHKDGRGYSTITSVRGVIKPAFQMACEEDAVRKNPFCFKLTDVVPNDSKRRIALTEEQQRLWMDFIRADKTYSKYYDEFAVLLGTGMRVSEFCGLTKDCIDFKGHKIIVDHQLLRTSQMEYVIEDTKTESGKRMVPMTPEVEVCFRKILDARAKPKIEPIIDGHSGFLFLDKNGMPMVALHWEKYFQHIVEKYNKIYKVQLPKITPHVCRHTFCSKMAKNGMNPKTLQYIMGHSDISVTLNTYTHVSFEDAQAEVKRMSAG